MKPMFSGVTVSNNTYNFWTSQTAQYISINGIRNNSSSNVTPTHLLEPKNIKSGKKK